MYNTAYSNLSSTPRKRDITVDIATIGKVAEVKSALYERAYNEISGLKASALNLKTYNQAANERIKGYNDEIQSFFKNDDLKNLDLTNGNIVGQYKQVFDKITGDTELRDYYQHEKQQESVMRTYQEASKNPSKTGYNQSNHIVWMHENWNPMVGSKDLKKAMTYQGTYLPGYDVRKDLESIKGQLHTNGSSVEIVDGSGRKSTFSIEELSSSRIQSYLRNMGLSQQAMNQLANDSKANTYVAWDSYGDKDRTSFINYKKEQEFSLYKEQIQVNDGQISYNEAKIAALQKEKGNEDKIQRLKEDNLAYRANKEQLSNILKQEYPTDKFGFAHRVASSEVARSIKNRADVMAYKIEKTGTGADTAFWMRDKAVLDKQKLELEKRKVDISEAGLALKQTIAQKNLQETGDNMSGVVGVVGGAQASTIKYLEVENRLNDAKYFIEFSDQIVNKKTVDDQVKTWINKALMKKEGESHNAIEIKINALANTHKGDYGRILHGLQESYDSGELNDALTQKRNDLQIYQTWANKAWDNLKATNQFGNTPEERSANFNAVNKTKLYEALDAQISETRNTYYPESYILDVSGDFANRKGLYYSIATNSPKRQDLKNFSQDDIDVSTYRYNPYKGELSFKRRSVLGDNKSAMVDDTVEVGTIDKQNLPSPNPIDMSFQFNGKATDKFVKDGIEYTVVVERIKGGDTQKTYKITAVNRKTGEVKYADSSKLTLNDRASNLFALIRQQPEAIVAQ